MVKVTFGQILRDSVATVKSDTQDEQLAKVAAVMNTELEKALKVQPEPEQECKAGCIVGWLDPQLAKESKAQVEACR